VSDRISSADLRALLAATTPGPWWPARHNGDQSVDRGKVYTHIDWPIRPYCVAVANVQLDTQPWRDNARLMALAPDLAAEVLALRIRVEDLDAEVTSLRAIRDPKVHPLDGDVVKVGDETRIVLRRRDYVDGRQLVDTHGAVVWPEDDPLQPWTVAWQHPEGSRDTRDWNRSTIREWREWAKG
jgi:hypothetical protein